MPNDFIHTRGARIAYRDTGGDGATALFLHYWGGSSRTWSKVMRELSGDVRCVAVDQRGWGRSVVTDGQYDVEAMANDVEDVVAALKLDRFVLVGHSMGGKVAQITIARGSIRPRALVLLAPAPPEPMGAPAEQREAMLASYQTSEGAGQALTVLAGSALDAADRAQVIEDTLAGALEAKREWTMRGMLAEVDTGLRAYSGPVRIVVGEYDRVERPDVLRDTFARRLPHATLDIVPGVGHLLPLECPAVVAAAVRTAVAD